MSYELVKRIIPRLDIKGENLVKGIHLEGLRILGKPEDYASIYYNQGADELFFVDVVASLYGRNSLHEVVRKVARNIFIPLTVGGGIRTINDIREVLKAGADKVVINTAALHNPNFIKEASETFGSSTIVVGIEAIKSKDGYYAYCDNGREDSGKLVKEWIEEVVFLGAGEIVITSVDKEGTGKGFDIDILCLISDTISIPIIAHGGCGTSQHVFEVLKNKKISGVAIASMFHYFLIENTLYNSSYSGNTEFIDSKRKNSLINSTTIIKLKEELSSSKINIRSTF
jgi:imidazole glycerol-phosphate synthase subunit HisF